MTLATERTFSLAEPYLLDWLASVGLDVEYIKAERNTLWWQDSTGAEVPVTDYAGGYGSLILGHNHPEIVARAQELLATGVPTHAQFSRHSYANDVAVQLNRLIGTDEPYSIIFASTGAEAIEAAIKHAELERVKRVAALRDEIDEHIVVARLAAASGARLEGKRTFDELEEWLRQHNAAISACQPLFLALDGGFHGKLAGSVQLTHNPAYRTPFSAMAAQARFVPFDQPDALASLVETENVSLFDLAVVDDVIQVVPRAFPVFAAFVVEPIQGEGGIREVSPEMAAAIQQTARSLDIPVVVDEIQSGLGRSGAFLASSQIGLAGDYYTLAKSLGGGVAKISALLVRGSRYQSDFELVHSSTFAKDAFSCHIALKTLELIESESAPERALALGARLTARLSALRFEYPDVVVDVRGRGLILGVEFADQSNASSPAIAPHAPFLGYAIAGYLLRKHGIRTFPTASAVTTLRFEPSIYLTDADISALEGGLRAVCEILRNQPDQGFDL